jgi:hypothetical protein
MPVHDRDVARPRGFGEAMLTKIVGQTMGQVGSLVDLALEIVLEFDAADGAAAMFDRGRLDLVHAIERRVVHQVRVLAEPRMDDVLGVAIAAPGESPMVFEQVASRLGQDQHPHVVTVGVGADRAGFQEALAGQRPNVLVQAAVGVAEAVAAVAAPDRLTVDAGRQGEATIGKRAGALIGVAWLVWPRRFAAAIISARITAIVVPAS